MATEVYASKKLIYKIEKVLRYIELYGPSRTLVKIKSQLHMERTDGFTGTRWENPSFPRVGRAECNVGLIGCGSFSFGNIAYYLNKIRTGCIRGTMDISAARAKSLASHYGAAYATTDAAEIVNDPGVRIVFIASSHSTHAGYAIAALDAGKHVHIEKPHVVSGTQLDDLLAAMRRNPEGKVFLGFNRPRSPLFIRLKKALDAEEGSAMINWFVAGHEIPDDHWYFSEVGGRILGNLCHWTDLTLNTVGIDKAFPCRVVPASIAGAKSDFITNIEFSDGSVATLSFSAKGHAFEGVREALNVHKGNVLAEIRDFGILTLSRGAKRTVIRTLFREHGHQLNIMNSYQGAINGAGSLAASEREVMATARLFLAVHEAHQTRHPIEVDL